MNILLQRLIGVLLLLTIKSRLRLTQKISVKLKTIEIKKILFIMISCCLINDLASANVLQYEQARAAYEKGELKEAERLFESAYLNFLKNLGDKHTNTLTALGDLSLVKNMLGKNSEALQMTQKIVSIRSETLGISHEDTLLSLNNLAAIYYDLGRTSEQLETLEKVYLVSNKKFGENNPFTLLVMNNLGETYRNLGRFSEALVINEKVLNLQTLHLSRKHPDTLLSVSNRAAIYRSLGDRDQELTLNKEVLRLRLEIKGETHPDTITSLNNLALTYDEIGQVDEAIPLYERVISLQSSIGKKNHRHTLLSMTNLANCYRKKGRLTESASMAESALELQLKFLGDQHNDTLQTIYSLAITYAAQRKNVRALELSKQFISGSEKLRIQPGLSLENRQSIFSQLGNSYRNLSHYSASNGEVMEGLRIAELSKARTLLESLSGQSALRFGDLPNTIQIQFQQLNQKIKEKKQTLAQIGNVSATIQLEAEINKLSRDFETLESEMKRKFPKYSLLNEIKPISPNSISGLLSPGSIALNFVVSNDVVSVFLIKTSEYKFIDLGRIPGLADAVEILRLSLSSEKNVDKALAIYDKVAWRLSDGSFSLLNKDISPPKYANLVVEKSAIQAFLSQKLLKPLEFELINFDHWLISPDSFLSQLPFEVLPWGKSNEAVINKIEVQYTQSMSIFALGKILQSRYDKSTDRKDLFAIGNPQYERIDVKSNIPRGISKTINLRGADQLRDLDNRWINLPGTEKEVRSVATLFPNSSTVFLGKEATEENLQKLNEQGELSKYRYLLFSVHGYLSPDNPALSSIVLGLQNRSANTDGYVTASELPLYDLRSDLAVISACDSGLGKVISGEGVMGLPFALFVAGNVNTILTLWPVDDDATAEFVTLLFKKIKSGIRPTAALSETKRFFLKHKTYSNPKYWAPFILIGAG